MALPLAETNGIESNANNWGQSKLKCLTQRSSGASLTLRPLSFALGCRQDRVSAQNA